jgi:hypothetical protein
VAVSVLVSVTCPWCGETSAIDASRRGADDFCRGAGTPCDYPLFWALDAAAHVVADDGEAEEESLRRQPGTAGRASQTGDPCPSCHEPNDPSLDACVRCGAALHPLPVMERLLPVPVASAAPIPMPPTPGPPWWRTWWALWAALVSAAVLVATADVVVVVRSLSS